MPGCSRIPDSTLEGTRYCDVQVLLSKARSLPEMVLELEPVQQLSHLLQLGAQLRNGCLDPVKLLLSPDRSNRRTCCPAFTPVSASAAPSSSIASCSSRSCPTSFASAVPCRRKASLYRPLLLSLPPHHVGMFFATRVASSGRAVALSAVPPPRLPLVASKAARGHLEDCQKSTRPLHPTHRQTVPPPCTPTSLTAGARAGK